MVERDYLMRIIQEFFEALAKTIHFKSTLKGEYPDYSVIQEKYNEMYERFLQKPPGYYYETDKETILDNLLKEDYSERDMLVKMQMIAELLYQDGLIKGYTQKRDLLEKALFLFDYIECKSNTYSWERDQRKIDIKKILY
jgi:hypothetical protein